MQYVLLRLPPRRHPTLPAGRGRGKGRTGGYDAGGCQGPRPGRPEVHHGRLHAGLHQLRQLRSLLPQVRQGTEDGPHPRGVSGPDRLELPDHREGKDLPRGQIYPEGQPVQAAPGGVQRCLRRLRRDALHQAADPDVRRQDVSGQRHRLYPGLGRGYALRTVLQERRGQGRGVVQLPVREQRRVLLRYVPGRQAAA